MALPAIAFMASAIPATTRTVAIRQPDGTMREVRLFGDEHAHIIATPDCKRMLRHSADNFLVDAGALETQTFRELWQSGTPKRLAPQKRAMGTTTFPAHGQQRAIAILVEFPKTPEHPEGLAFSADDPRGLFDDMLNRDGFDHDGATGSVHEYFLKSSNGLFDLTFDVYGPVTLEKDLAYYGTKINGEDLNAWNMVVEACKGVDGQVDFSSYDRDHDGVIDNVYIFYAGPGAATGGDPSYTVWQHAADLDRLTSEKFTFDGVRLNHYACSNEYRDVRSDDGSYVRQMEGIGTVTHEFSHVMGLPDLYDTKGTNLATPGTWSNMDTGCHLNDSRTPPLSSSFERMSLGWLDPKQIGSKSESLTLRDISNNEAYMIPTDRPEEYFLLENRQQKGWDSYLPGHGMLIWHINYMADYWKANQVNTQRGYLGVDILRADGNASIGSLGGDTFPGNEGVTTISDDGYPNMRTLSGDRTNAPLSNINEAGGIVTFDICKLIAHLEQVAGLSASDVTPTSFTAHWQPLANSSVGYLLNLFRTDGVETTIVEPYRNFNVAGSEFQFANLDPESNYLFNVTATAGNVNGETSETFAVTTPAMTFEFMRPTAPMASNIEETSFTATWEPLAEAADYIVDLYTKTKGEPDIAKADFTGGIDQLPPGWVTNSSMTMSISGYYGAESPSLSMPDDYGRIQSPSLGSPLRSISFWFRERSGSGNSHIEISVLANGKWCEVDRIDLSEKMTEGQTYSLDEESGMIPEEASAVKIVYRRVDKGTLAIDDIAIGYNDNHTIIPVESWTGRRLQSSATAVDVDGLKGLTNYFFTVKGVDSKGTISLPSAELSITTKAGARLANDELNPETDIELFDLSGRRVNPSGNVLPRGIYIVKKGSKIEKVIL